MTINFIKKQKNQPELIIGIILWLLTFSLYVYSACPVNPGYADSDEIITVSHLLGVAHPPGYPLQTVLTKAFMLLPIPGTMAFRANLLSAFLHSLTLLFIYLTGLKLINLIKKENKHFSSLTTSSIAAVSTLFLAFSALFWLYSGISEVFALNDFLASLTIWSAFKWKSTIDKKTFSFSWFLAVCSLIGIGLSHVQTFILILPSLFLFFIFSLQKSFSWKTISKLSILSLFPIFLGFILPNLLLFLFNAKQANVSWIFTQDIHGWLRHLLRQDYSGYNPITQNSLNAYIAKIDITKWLRDFFTYFKFLTSHFSFIGVLLSFIGFIRLYKKDRKIFSALLLLFLLPGPVLAMYMGFPSDPSALDYHLLLGTTHRQYLLGETMLGLTIIFGLWEITTKLWQIVKKDTINMSVACSLFIILSLSWCFYNNYSIGVQRKNTTAWDYAHNVLTNIPSDSVIVCFSDFTCMSLFYAQEVENLRPDVAIFSKNPNIKGYYVQHHSQLHGYSYIENPFFTGDIISWNVNSRPTYVTELEPVYNKQIGLDDNPFFIIPEGYLFQVVTKIPPTISTPSYSISQTLIKSPSVSKDYLSQSLKDIFSNFHTVAGAHYARIGQVELAKQNFLLATKLNQNYKLPSILYNNLSSLYIDNRLNSFDQASTSAQLLIKGKQLIEQKQLKEGVSLLYKSLYADPKNLEARLLLASLYQAGSYTFQAKREYENVLKYFPDNQTAQERIKELPVNPLTNGAITKYLSY